MRYFLMLFFLLTFVGLRAQEGAIQLEGKLIDAETGKPLSFASILIVNKRQGLASTNTGEFRFGVDLGDLIKITSIGYEEQLFVVNAELIENLPLTILMVPRSYELDSIEVFGLSDNFYLKRPKRDTLTFELPFNIEDLPANYPPSKYVPLYGENTGVTLLSIPIFNIIDKNPKQARKIQAMESAKSFKTMRAAEREKYFNKEIVKKVTRIDDRVIDEFMAFCQFLDGEIIGKSEYEITMKILDKYQAFLRR